MAKTIATISGIALRPGVSKNSRWYTPEHIAGAVTRAKARISDGSAPMAMLTFHGADDNSREIAASLTSMSLEEDGSARFEAGIPDTVAGRDIAALLDTSDGKRPHLKGVSIRGYWTGKVREEDGPDGQRVTVGDGLELDGVDFTKNPGVPGAEVDSFAWTGRGPKETAERVLITESVEDVAVLTEETPHAQGSAAPAGLRETLSLFLGEPAAEDVEEAGGTPAMSKRGSGLSGSGRVWADPGYQADKRQRYDISTKGKAATAWRYINQKAKADKYTPAQLKRVKGRIKAALRKFGVSVSAEHAPGWGFTEAVQVAPGTLEALGLDPGQSGSWCISASNGPVHLALSSYSMDPADLNVILKAAADAACQAFAALDPDMDGDVDVPGAGDNSDTDGDAGQQAAPPPQHPATEENAPVVEAGTEGPAEAGTEEERGDPAVAEETNTESGAGAQSGLTLEDVQKTAAEAAAAAVTAAFEARDKAKKDRKKTAKEKAPEPAPAAPVAEDDDARTARIVAEALKAAGVTPPPAAEPAVETEEQKVTRIVQGLIANGSVNPARKGSDPAEAGTPAPGGDGTLNEHGLPSGWPAKPLHEFTPDEMKQYCAPVLDEMIFGGRSDRSGRPLSVLSVPS